MTSKLIFDLFQVRLRLDGLSQAVPESVETKKLSSQPLPLHKTSSKVTQLCSMLMIHMSFADSFTPLPP